MQAFDRWIAGMSPDHIVLDLGCGSGSLREHLADLRVIGVDLDLAGVTSAAGISRVCARSKALPFAAASFDLVVCNHSLEHFTDVDTTLREIGRVLKADGRLFISVPDGNSLTDRLYRFLLCGGDHFQRFTYASLVHAVEAGTGFHLIASQELFSSFIFVNRATFLPAPRGRLPGPFPRRMRWLGHLPDWFFVAARFSLNAGSRLLDRCFSTSLARYGWAFAFEAGPAVPQIEAGSPNVCMSCGAGAAREDLQPVTRWFYRCRCCATVNILF